MRKRRWTNEEKLSLISEYYRSGKSIWAFSEEKGLGHSRLSEWIRIFAVEDKPVEPSPQVAVTDMKKDPDKEELLQEIDRLKQELRLKSPDFFRMGMP